MKILLENLRLLMENTLLKMELKKYREKEQREQRMIDEIIAEMARQNSGIKPQGKTWYA